MYCGVGKTSDTDNKEIKIEGKDVNGMYYVDTRQARLADTYGGPMPGTYFYHYDHLGSTVIMTDATGEEVTRVYYSPFGELDITRTAGIVNLSNTYTGQTYDQESGLLYYGARYYDANVGRFLTVDTVVPGDGADPMGFNRYAYARNNPIKYTDPTGHNIFEDAYNYGKKKYNEAKDWVKGAAKDVGDWVVGDHWTAKLFRAAVIGAVGLTLGMYAGAIMSGNIAQLFGYIVWQGSESVIGGAIVGGISGGVNGALAGYYNMYDNVGDFLVDSTWGLPGTTLGLGTMGYYKSKGGEINTGWTKGNNSFIMTGPVLDGSIFDYRNDPRGFVANGIFSLGNVTVVDEQLFGRANTGNAAIDRQINQVLSDAREELRGHIDNFPYLSRIFGPLYPISSGFIGPERFLPENF